MKKSLFRRSILILLVLLSVFALSACKNKQMSKEEYAEKADSFYKKIQEYGKEIDSINPNDVGASAHLLGVLDLINDEVKSFAECNPPSGLKPAQERAQSAAGFMQEAVSQYHKALETDTVDQTALDLATYNYGNAIIEIKNIGIALQNAE